MITSVNVNQYCGECWKEAGFRLNVEEFFHAYIKTHLVNDGDVLLLQEVPYVVKVPYKTKDGTEGFRRGTTVVNSCRRLEAYCLQNGFKLLEPVTLETSFFRTIAIQKGEQYKRADVDNDDYFSQYTNRVVVLQKGAEYLIGVHAPNEETENLLFLSDFDKLCKSLESRAANCTITIMGDFNIFAADTEKRQRLQQFMAEHKLIDVWLENGGSHLQPTYAAGTRIDLALMSAGRHAKEKPRMYVDEVIRAQKMTDHAAIILL